jgi:excisionase family DNA binding protein
MSVSTVDAAALTASVREAAALLDVRAVAGLLTCSPRHVYRLSDAGRMPAPIKLGGLVRWRADEIRDWINGGCKPVRQAKGA